MKEFIVIVAGSATFIWLGSIIGRESMEKQAVERGCGRYVVTAEREVKFEWVDCARKEQGK